MSLSLIIDWFSSISTKSTSTTIESDIIWLLNQTIMFYWNFYSNLLESILNWWCHWCRVQMFAAVAFAFFCNFTANYFRMYLACCRVTLCCPDLLPCRGRRGPALLPCPVLPCCSVPLPCCPVAFEALNPLSPLTFLCLSAFTQSSKTRRSTNSKLVETGCPWGGVMRLAA